MQPNLGNLKKRIRENRDIIDRISAKLPGFKGYADRADSHDADAIIRNLLADRIRKFKNVINAKSLELAKRGEYLTLPDFESLDIELETVVKKCQHAGSGASASLSRIAVTGDDMARLLEYDWSLITAIDDLEKMADEIRTASADNLGAVTREFASKLKEFEKNFDERKNVLLEVL